MSDATAPFEDAAYVEALRAQMLRFARRQLGDADLAEDAVQEALLGAMRNAGAFGARSAFRTWVFGILKHKIADALRQRRRFVSTAATGDEDREEDEPDGLFESDGHWSDGGMPARWSAPEASLADREFWRVFETCLEVLPPVQGRVFMMREFVGLEAEEICKAVGVTQTNLYVLLHRARLRLRACLGGGWFGEGKSP